MDSDQYYRFYSRAKFLGFTLGCFFCVRLHFYSSFAVDAFFRRTTISQPTNCLLAGHFTTLKTCAGSVWGLRLHGWIRFVVTCLVTPSYLTTEPLGTLPLGGFFAPSPVNGDTFLVRVIFAPTFGIFTFFSFMLMNMSRFDSPNFDYAMSGLYTKKACISSNVTTSAFCSVFSSFLFLCDFPKEELQVLLIL
jgi:hypothetical protein